MKNWILALGALSLMGGACNPIVLEPLQGTEVVDTPVDPASSLPRGGGAETVLGMRWGDVNWQNNFSLDVMLDKPWSDPETLMLFFSTDSQTCDNPVLVAPCNEERTVWQFVVGIPPELARPGRIDLLDPRLTHYSAISYFTGDMPCAQSVGAIPGMLPGTLDLISDGSGSLSVKLQGVSPFTSISDKMGPLPPGNIDGQYTVQPCGALPTAAPPVPALAIRGADLSPSPAGGVHPDADSVVVFLGTLPDTCQDPWAAPSCKEATRLSFTLPVALQKPGVISLADPAISATYTVAAAPGTSACGLPTGPLDRGTIEILSSDAGGLTFKIHDSTAVDASFITWFYFDGLYHAPICP